MSIFGSARLGNMPPPFSSRFPLPNQGLLAYSRAEEFENATGHDFAQEMLSDRLKPVYI
jgi:hypothetical protein